MYSGIRFLTERENNEMIKLHKTMPHGKVIKMLY